jgi:hypothetical protein
MSCSTDLLPERVELRQRERARALEAGHRGRPDEHHLGAPLDHPLQLLDGLLDDGQGDHGGGEDPALVVELPGLVHPLVQGVDGGVEEVRVVLHPLLDHAGERGEHQRAVEALLVHELEARGRLPERRRRLDRLAEQLAAALPLRVADPVVLLLGARPRHHLEGRVRDVLGDPAAHRQLGATVLQLHVLDGAAVPVGQVPGERLRGLVEVVVGVEDRDAGRCSHRGPPSDRWPAGGVPPAENYILPPREPRRNLCQSGQYDFGRPRTLVLM